METPLQQSAKEFWDWFAANHHPYRFLQEMETDEEREHYLRLLRKNLEDFSQFVFAEVSEHNYNTRLTLSADANLNYFPFVEALANQAPELEGWEIVAFKPALGNHFNIPFLGQKVRPEQIHFLARPNHSGKTRIDLILLFDSLVDENKHQFRWLAHQMVLGLLGEEVFGKKIAHLDIAATPKQIEKYPVKRLHELPEWVAEVLP